MRGVGKGEWKAGKRGVGRCEWKEVSGKRKVGRGEPDLGSWKKGA